MSGCYRMMVALAILPLYLCGCGRGPIEDAKQLSDIRAGAIQDSATSYGARVGLAIQSKIINKSLGVQSKHLDQIFDFKRIMLAHNVLPPILIESSNNLNLNNSHAIRLSDRTYQIIAPAKFVTTPPSWRDYLSLKYKMPEKPNPTLLPHNSQERAVWDKHVVKGWENGITQADDIFRENLNRLARDFKGMALYHALAAKNMVTQPYVAKARLGITGDAQKLDINTRLLRITSDASLQPDSRYWDPALYYEKSVRTDKQTSGERIPRSQDYKKSLRASTYRSMKQTGRDYK